MARFGHLYLNRGNWNGKQVIPADWVDAATRTQVPVDLPVGDTDRANVRGPGAYGFNWWTNGGENRMPDAPPKTYYASGLNHNLLFVIPEWNMVVVRMGVDGNPPMGKPQAWNGFFARLGQAFMPPKAEPVASTDPIDRGLVFKLDFEGDLTDQSDIGHDAEVLYDGQPHVEINDLWNVDRVMQAGRWIK